jgi:hypothetical protein
MHADGDGPRLVPLEDAGHAANAPFTESAKLSKKSRKWTERQAARAAIASAEEKWLTLA